MPNTPAQDHTMLVEAAVGWYREFFAVTIGWLFQGGQVPGLELVGDSKLRQFFESTSPQYWTQLTKTQPEEAMSQLVQWANADKQNTGEGGAPSLP